MPDRRSLTLRREALAELAGDQAARVVAAASGVPCLSATTCPGGTWLQECLSLKDCLSLDCTNGPCASDFQECHTTGC